MMAGEALHGALNDENREAEGTAVFRRLMDHYPSLYFTGDRITDLEDQGRDDEAFALAQSSFAANPDNLASGRELTKLLAQRGTSAAALATARHMQLVYGDDRSRPRSRSTRSWSATTWSARSASRIACSLGSALQRARGATGSSIAVMQGRFAAAYAELKVVLEEFCAVR